MLSIPQVEVLRVFVVLRTDKHAQALLNGRVSSNHTPTLIYKLTVSTKHTKLTTVHLKVVERIRGIRQEVERLLPVPIRASARPFDRPPMDKTTQYSKVLPKAAVQRPMSSQFPFSVLLAS